MTLVLLQPTEAAPLDEALALVLEESPVVAEVKAEASAIARQSDWSGKVRLGYNHYEYVGDVVSEPNGAFAGVTFEIPLFSKKREIEAARARHQAAQARDELRVAFLADVAKLRELEAQRAESAEMAEFYRDRLSYFKKAVDEGRVESDTLWSDAEKAKKAEHDARQGAVKLDAAMEETARRFGGNEWNRLSALLAAHVKRNGR